MDYYQIYLNRIFMLGQVEIRQFSMDQKLLLEMTLTRKKSPATEAERRALCAFVAHLAESVGKLQGKVLLSTRNGFSFCGGKLELVQGSCLLVLGPFYLNSGTPPLAPEFNDPALRCFENAASVNSFLPLLFDSFQGMVTDSFLLEEKEQAAEDSILLNDNKAIAKNHELETEIRSAIYHGDRNQLQHLLRDASFYAPSHYDVGSRMRDRRNLALTLNALSSRAAMDGGCSLYYIRSLSAAYAEKIEWASTAEELDALSSEFCQRYCRLTAEARGVSHSPVVNQCLGYIRAHLSEELTLEMLADAVSLSYSHLSRLLKKECGKSFTQLVASLRMKRASKLLLRGGPGSGDGRAHRVQVVRSFLQGVQKILRLHPRRVGPAVGGKRGRPEKLQSPDLSKNSQAKAFLFNCRPGRLAIIGAQFRCRRLSRRV